MKKILLLALVFVAAAVFGFASSSQAAALPCSIDIAYPDVTVLTDTGGFALPGLAFNGDCELDDPRIFTLISGPNWVSLNGFNGKVTYWPHVRVLPGDYNVTVKVEWACACGTVSDTTTFTITVY